MNEGECVGVALYKAGWGDGEAGMQRQRPIVDVAKSHKLKALLRRSWERLAFVTRIETDTVAV